MIMTQAVTEFFLSEDIANFTIKNDDSRKTATLCCRLLLQSTTYGNVVDSPTESHSV